MIDSVVLLLQCLEGQVGYHNLVSTADKHLCGGECLCHCVCACLRLHVHACVHTCMCRDMFVLSLQVGCYQQNKQINWSQKTICTQKNWVDQRFSVNIHNTCFST